MAYNGGKGGFTSAPSHSSTPRMCRLLFLCLIICVIAVSYYCWSTMVHNTMLQDRVNRLARDFSLMRNQRSETEKSLAECKNRLSDATALHSSVSKELKDVKREMTELHSAQDAERSASAACEEKLRILTQQHGEDMKAVTHEVTDCKSKLDSVKSKLDSMREECSKYGRMEQLRVLKAVYSLTGSSILQRLKEDFHIDISGVEPSGASQVRQPPGQQSFAASQLTSGQHQHAPDERSFDRRPADQFGQQRQSPDEQSFARRPVEQFGHQQQQHVVEDVLPTRGPNQADELQVSPKPRLPEEQSKDNQRQRPGDQQQAGGRPVEQQPSDISPSQHRAPTGDVRTEPPSDQKQEQMNEVHEDRDRLRNQDETPGKSDYTLPKRAETPRKTDETMTNNDETTAPQFDRDRHTAELPAADAAKNKEEKSETERETDRERQVDEQKQQRADDNVDEKQQQEDRRPVPTEKQDDRDFVQEQQEGIADRRPAERQADRDAVDKERESEKLADAADGAAGTDKKQSLGDADADDEEEEKERGGGDAVYGKAAGQVPSQLNENVDTRRGQKEDDEEYEVNKDKLRE